MPGTSAERVVHCDAVRAPPARRDGESWKHGPAERPVMVICGGKAQGRRRCEEMRRRVGCCCCGESWLMLQLAPLRAKTDTRLLVSADDGGGAGHVGEVAAARRGVASSRSEVKDESARVWVGVYDAEEVGVG